MDIEKEESFILHKEQAWPTIMNMKKFAFIMPLMAISLLASCNNGGADKPEPDPSAYTVTCGVEGATLSNYKAYTDKDYQTKITVNQNKIGEYYSVPQTLTKITSSNKEITNYTYTPVENTYSADLLIPKGSVIGDIKIEFKLMKLTSLCFTAQEANSTVGYTKGERLTSIHIQTSPDDKTWTDWDGTNKTLSNVGDKIYVKNTTNHLTTSLQVNDRFKFKMSGKIAASGNVNSMINNNNPNAYCFGCLFDGCESLVTAPCLPSLTLAVDCYWYTFGYCTHLTDAPFLPSSELKYNCYCCMFDGCEALSKAPTLLATTLADGCYKYMFENCTNLNYVNVGFGIPGQSTWPEPTTFTQNWLKNVSASGTFRWHGLKEIDRSVNTVPDGWTVETY